MKCYGCGENLTGTSDECPVCHFQVMGIIPLENPEEERKAEEKRRSLGRQYRKNKLKGTEVGLTLYSYAMKDDKIRKSKESRKVLADVSQMEIGDTKWLDQELAHTNVESLDVFVRNDDDSEFYTVEVTAPKAEGFLHVGVELLEGLKVSLVLEAGGEVTKSQPFQLKV